MPDPSQTSSASAEDPATSPSTNTSSATERLEDLLNQATISTPGHRQDDAHPANSQVRGAILEELSDSSSWESDSEPSKHVTMASTQHPVIPRLFTTLPPLRDVLETETSILQDATTEEVLPYLSAHTTLFTSYNKHGIPPLLCTQHISFLHKSLLSLPAPYTSADAGRPWFFYWALCGLSSLGVNVTPYRERLISTVRACQHPEGGFGGGHGQMSHLAPSYAILLSLAMVGGKRAYDAVDRLGMWRWLGRCKNEKGAFAMSVGGEVDVRGVYCAVTLISLLNLPIELPEEEKVRFPEGADLLTGLPEWLARCQTFEGGISSRPDAEAHGAYAFCALACLCVLGSPQEIIPKYLDVPLLISWLSARQYAPEGGFAGRTNKLVDGCYSHWIGGCWPIIEAVMHPQGSPGAGLSLKDSLYSREGLIRYIMCCCQETTRRGGLRDKPSKLSDAYHSCYVLAGLSAAQHTWDYNSSSPPSSVGGNDITAPFRWTPADHPTYEDSITGEQVFDEEDRVEALHPVFVIPIGKAEAIRKHCVGLPPLV